VPASGLVAVEKFGVRQPGGKGDSLPTPRDLVVIGGSAGAIQALPVILQQLPETFGLPVVVVLHRLEGTTGYLHQYFGQYCALRVVEVDDKQPLRGGQVYIAPAGYHTLIEAGGHFSLSIDPKVNYSRPSIDVLFESAVDVYTDGLVGIILTGASSDGSAGLKKIKEAGGLTVVQRPSTAVADFMPRAALRATKVDKVLDLQDIGCLLARLQGSQGE
jgi:two-component system, chemotaxis family, protein-glutamate methylesterase/glutaminase